MTTWAVPVRCSTPDGTVTQTRYLPFGGYRDGSGGNPMTDRGYTGHKHNDDLGLIYMNARFYVPGIARFASADTIVPDPMNPQSFNRYVYVGNNPVRLIDPSGHFEEDAIYKYILNNECGASIHCADSMMEEWSQDLAWWGMLLVASANDVLYGMIDNGAGKFTFKGSGMEQLDGISGDGGIWFRLSALRSGSFTIPQVIDSSGRIANNVYSPSHPVSWEALQFHQSGRVVLREDFAGVANALNDVLGSQFIPPTANSIWMEAFNAGVEEGVSSAVSSWKCGKAASICEIAYSAISAALSEGLRVAEYEKGDMIRYTSNWEFRSRGFVTTATQPPSDTNAKGTIEWGAPDHILRR